MKGKVSKYHNQNTPLSIKAIEAVTEAANTLTVKDLEAAQIKHGISDSLIVGILGVTKSQISRIKKGDSPLTQSGKIALYLFLKTLES